MKLKRLKFVTNLLLTETTYHLFLSLKNGKTKPLFPQYFQGFQRFFLLLCGLSKNGLNLDKL